MMEKTAKNFDAKEKTFIVKVMEKLEDGCRIEFRYELDRLKVERGISIRYLLG